MMKITCVKTPLFCDDNCSGAAASWFLCRCCISFPFSLDLDSLSLQTDKLRNSGRESRRVKGSKLWKGLHLRLGISLWKSLFDISCYRKENLLDIQVCLCTLQQIIENKLIIHQLWYKECHRLKLWFSLTVSKNFIPYSSARACPFEVGTAFTKENEHVRNKCYYKYRV